MSDAMYELPLFVAAHEDSPTTPAPVAPSAPTNQASLNRPFPAAAREALAKIHINRDLDQATLTLPQLPPRTYAAVNRVLLACGFVWNRLQGTHLGTLDNADALERALLAKHYHYSKQDLATSASPEPITDDLPLLEHTAA
jgi:hypothetical protein